MHEVKRTRRSALSSSDPVSSTRHRSGEVARPQTHVPVLLHEVLACLDLQPDDVVVDATLGGAGHAKEIAKMLGEHGVLIGFDADPAAIERAHNALGAVALARSDEKSGAGCKTYLEQENFRSLQVVLEKYGFDHITKALFDLGWSSYQLENGKGFSFRAHDPLLMTYGDLKPDTLTASIVVNSWREESIADILYGWGEERYARRIARAIVEARSKKKIEFSDELGEIIASAVPAPYRHGAIHPATKTFQALRIAVNDELGVLKTGLTAAWRALSPGGVLAVITFHSIEDREVKTLMREWKQAGEGELLSKKPIPTSDEERRTNPRSRSAKLRAIRKI